MDVYDTMQGPNEFLYTGDFNDWNRIPDMQRITQPCLISTGMHDELTPACARRMQQALPDAKLVVFKNSSYLAHWEEQENYFRTLLDFLAAQPSKPKAAEAGPQRGKKAFRT
jgi:proline iminopeptidase